MSVGDLQDAALRASEARRAAMFDAALDCIISIDHEGTILEFNTAAESTFGHRREDVVGRELAEVVIPHAYREAHRRGLAQYLATGEGPVIGQRLELSGLRADGTEFPIELTVTRIPMDGPPTFTAYLRDISHRKGSDDMLRASEERYRTLFESAPMAVFVCDRNAVIQTYNSVAAKLWGREPERGVEKHCGSVKLWLPDGSLLPHFESPMIEVLRTGIPALNIEVYIERPDGSRLPVLVNFAPLRSEEGEVTGVVTSFVDIAERKEAEEALRESEERFRMMSDNIPQLAWIADAGTDGQVHWFNKSWLDYTGATLEQMRGSGWQTVHHPDHAERVVEKFQRHVSESKDWEDTFPLRGKDGEFRWFLSRMKVIRDESGSAVRIFGTNTDITKQRRVEEELRESEERLRSMAAELERRVEERTGELQAAVRELEGFCYSVSHDFRAPLRAINSSARILEQDYKHALPSEARELLDRQAYNANRLAQLIDDLLQFSRVGRAEINRKAFDLTELAREVVVEVKSQQRFHDTDVTVQPGLAAEGDPKLLKLALHNLIDNACKFRQPDGPHCVEVGRNGDGYFVRDTGVGFNPEFANYMFQPFHRLHTDDEFPGTGIGLANVKRVIERHGGRVWAESAGEGQGATFHFTLS